MSTPPAILVVEDHLDLREVLSMILRHHGFDVFSARDGAEAVEVASERRPDLILMDLMMPRMDGYAAAKKLTANGAPRIPIVAITASQAHRNELERCGFSGLLRKPVRVDELLSVVRKCTDPDRDGGWVEARPPKF